MMESIVLYGLLGIVAGLLAGLLGVGGGIVIVPMLVFAFGRSGFAPESIMLLALATSLGSIMFTSVSSALAHSRRGAVDWLSVLRISPGILLGTFAGTYVAVLLSRRFLQIFFVIFLTYVAVQMLRGSRPRASRTLPGTWGMGAAGGIDIVVPNYGWYASPIGNMTRKKCAGLAMEFHLGIGGHLTTSNAQDLIDDGYGWFMGFAPSPEKYNSIFNRLGGTNTLYGSALKEPTIFYKKDDPTPYSWPADL